MKIMSVTHEEIACLRERVEKFIHSNKTLEPLYQINYIAKQNIQAKLLENDSEFRRYAHDYIQKNTNSTYALKYARMFFKSPYVEIIADAGGYSDWSIVHLLDRTLLKFQLWDERDNYGLYPRIGECWALGNTYSQDASNMIIITDINPTMEKLYLNDTHTVKLSRKITFFTVGEKYNHGMKPGDYANLNKLEGSQQNSPEHPPILVVKNKFIWVYE